MKNNAVILLILDGWGYGRSWGGNAITIAETPNYDRILREYPHTIMAASGVDVGLTGHEVGNSEVGHMNIGAGAVVKQNIRRINDSIKNGSFYRNPVLVNSINASIKEGSSIHLMGIVSDGGIHSHIVHLFALVKLCHDLGHKKVFIHAFTDGRDTDPMTGIEFLNKLQMLIERLKTGKIASIIGRLYLDRKGDWQRTEKAYNLLVEGTGEQAHNALAAISASYKRGITDEFVRPTVIGGTESRIKDNDTVIFFNFRSDRTRQLMRAFLQEDFDKFKRRKLNNLDFITFIPYGIEREIGVEAKSAFETVSIENTIGRYIEKCNLRQFHIAETEKYAHVTFFINGNRDEPYQKEDRVLVPSPQVRSYAEKPEMSAEEVKNNLITRIKRNVYSFTVCNFANPDMVGHTGDFKAAVKAVEFLDLKVKEVVEICVNMAVPLIITADHGNIEQMVDPSSGQPYTEHTVNPVPFIVVSPEKEKIKIKSGGRLANVTGTCLELLGHRVPQYFYPSLIERIQ